jgi:hypothetical protein
VGSTYVTDTGNATLYRFSLAPAPAPVTVAPRFTG